LKDHFFDHLSHSEIADKRNIAVGSVGTYLQRGIKCLRDIVARKPKLQNELREALTDISTAHVLLPLAFAIQPTNYHPRLHASIRASRIQKGGLELFLNQLFDQKIIDKDFETTLADLSETKSISSHQSTRLIGELKAKFPAEVETWVLRKKQAADLALKIERAYKRNAALRRISFWMAILTLIVIGLLWLVTFFD
jgi:hypothetical protein